MRVARREGRRAAPAEMDRAERSARACDRRGMNAVQRCSNSREVRRLCLRERAACADLDSCAGGTVVLG
jgi:hypothetical protein